MYRRYSKIQVLILGMVLFSAITVVLYGLVRDRVQPTLADPVYQGDESVKQIALAVNVDWGEEYVPMMLDVFSKHGAKATFFITGRWAELHPDLVRLIKDKGHEIGNHGYGHPHPDHLSVEQNRADIIKAEDAIYQACGVRPHLYAPPYGERGEAVLKAAEQSGYRVILWSLDTVDWKLRNAEAIRERVKGRMHNGAIVLMHPTEPTVQALGEILPYLENKGLKSVTVSTLLANEKHL